MNKHVDAPRGLYSATASEPSYAGFWVRTLAAIVDTLCLMGVVMPLLWVVYGKSYWQSEKLVQGGADLLIQYALPALAIILFWLYKSATPGKMLFRLRIMDAATGAGLTKGQAIGRYAAYYLSALPFLLGILWVAFDSRKQGWHDKLAGTVVVHDRRA